MGLEGIQTPPYAAAESGLNIRLKPLWEKHIAEDVWGFSIGLISFDAVFIL